MLGVITYSCCAESVSRRGIQASPAVLADVVAKQNTDKRQRQAEKARIRNKGRKSAVKTRMKKVPVLSLSVLGSICSGIWESPDAFSLDRGRESTLCAGFSLDFISELKGLFEVSHNS